MLRLISAALLWSLGGLLIKSIPWPPLAVAGGRGIVAAIFLFVAGGRLRFTFSPLQLAGAAGYAVCTIGFCLATKTTTAANAILLQYTGPVWVALLGPYFLREPVTGRDWAAIAAVLGGMALFLADGLAVGHFGGDLAGAISGVGFAGMILALRKQPDGPIVESLILGNVLAFAVGMPAIAAAPPLPATGWLALLFLGAVQLGLSYRLYAEAIPHVTALEASLIPIIEPILNPVWVMIAIGEHPTPLACVGGAVVVGAAVCRALAAVRRRT